MLLDDFGKICVFKEKTRTPDGEGGTLYKCVQAHTSQSDWMPSATPALWKTVSVD